MPKATDQFALSNRLRGLHVFFQIILAMLFFGGLNYVAMKHFKRYDLSQNRFFSLSPETQGYIHSLDKPVHFIVTIPANSSDPSEQLLFDYVENLLTEYAYEAREANVDKLLTVEYVEVDKNRNRARELVNQYGIDQENVVLVANEENFRVITPSEILEFQDSKPTVFKGEQIFTTALVELSASETPTIYFTVGHGEMRLDDVSPQRGLSQLAIELHVRNFDLGALDLSQVNAVPENADAVVVVDPMGPFLPSEQEKLRSYLHDRAGRMLLLTSPGKEIGLDELLFDWGLRTDDMLVLEQGSDFKESTGSYLIRQFAQHPITNPISENQVPLVSGAMKPMRPDLGAPIDDRLHIVPLMGSSKQSWAEQSYRSGQSPQFDPAVDLPGPVVIGSVAERRSSTQLEIDIPGGRIVALGTGDLFSNRHLSNALGNQLFFISTMNWMLERDQVLALPPLPIENYRITVSRAQFQRLAMFYLIVPGITGLIGLAVLWFRKI